MWWSKQVCNLNGLAFTVLLCCLNELALSNTEIFRGCWPYMSSIQSLGTCCSLVSISCILRLLTLKSHVEGPEASATII